MTETEFQLVKSAGFVLALSLAVGLQRWRPFAAPQGSWRVNAGLWATNALVMGVFCGACACTVSRWAQEAGIGLQNVAPAPYAASALLSVLALDLVSYAWHRWNHAVPALWRFHQAHHSDPTFTTTTALRFHPGELLLSLPLRLTAVALLGVPVVAIIVFEVCFALANFVEHGNIRLPLGFERRMAWLFVTPALHRRHHGRRSELLDSNFATIFSFWDRLFGTFGPNDSATPVAVGLPGIAEPLTVAGTLALPLRRPLRGE